MSKTVKLSEYVTAEFLISEVDTIEKLSQQLGIKLSENERTKILESSKKFVDVFNNELSDFKETIDDATYEDIDYLGEFNSSKQVVLASSEIKAKVIMSTTSLDKKMDSISKNEFNRNVFDIVMQKTKEEKQREILVGFMDYMKHKQDEFNLFSQEITINISNLKKEKEVVRDNARSLSKKAIMLTVTSIFFKSVLPHIDNLQDEDYQSKLIALDRRLRTMFEILYVTQKNIIDIDNQTEMYNELQNVIDEYKVSAMRIISMEIKNRVILQDIKAMYESLNSVRKTVNNLISENTKLTKQLVGDIHVLSKDSILDKAVITSSVENATQIKDGSNQRSVDTYKQIQQDNQEFIAKISTMIKNDERWNEKQNTKNMLDL
jgi:hypothetical protein